MLSTKYLFVKLRTNRKYLVFLFLQLVLSLSIIIVGLVANEHFRNAYILALQILLSLCIAFDLIVRANSESHFWRSKGNILDIVVFVCLIALIVYVSVTKGKSQDEVVVEADDIILLVVIVCRYAVQVVRIGLMIKKSAESMQMQKELKEIDLNNPPEEQSKTNPHSEHQTHGSQVLRNKMMNFVLSNKDDQENKLGQSDHAHKPLQEES